MTKQQAPGAFERIAADSVRPDPIHPKVRQMEVIDTDFHFNPPWEALKKRMPATFADRMWSYPATNSEINPECANLRPGMGQNTQGSAATAEDILRICDANGVDTVIVNNGYNRPQSIFNEPVIAAITSAYNDYMIEEVFPVSDRIKGTIALCHRDPEMGAKEIRRVGHHPQFVSFLVEFGGNYESPGTAKFDPIFDAARDMGNLPMTAHTSGYMSNFTPLIESARTWVELFGNMTSASCMMNVGSYIMQGLFDKYPDLKILTQEGGFFWIPDICARLDDFYMCHPHDIAMCERMVEMGQRYLKKLPSEYLHDHIRFSTQPMPIHKDRKDWEMMLKLCRADELFLYSSDWPHQTFDPANWVVENPDIIDEDMQRAILSGNAKKFYNLL